MIKIEITIPLFYNDKTPIEQTKFDKIKRELLREFKGLTISDNVKGYWIDEIDKNTDFNNIDNTYKVYIDINKIYTVIAEDNKETKSWINNYKKWLEYMLKQKEIFIVITKGVNII